jgi:crotonobetainyl-CoA:carnitine CoA-transferase CaiB-like acyl-CoA transferase
VRVLDFTWMLAGPYATRILADCGAEVIKVQSAKTAKGAELNTTGYFNTWNRNKRSITLDLSHPEAREIILNLTAVSDIVVENFSPRVMPNWGLSYSALREVKPDLIMASISAMGQTGPWRNYTGYGPTFHALSGLTSMTSSGQKSPIGLGHAYADTIIGLYSALAMLAALKYRDTTGEGQYIDISGYEAICTLLGPALLDAGINKNIIRSADNDICAIPTAPCGCYRCAGDDRWCVIAVFDDNEWRTFCHLLGDPDWMSKKAFSTSIRRIENRTALDNYIEAWTCLNAPETVVDLLRNNGISAGIVQNTEDISKDPCLRSRNFFTELIHRTLGKTISDRSALTFSKETMEIPLLRRAGNYRLILTASAWKEKSAGQENLSGTDVWTLLRNYFNKFGSHVISCGQYIRAAITHISQKRNHMTPLYTVAMGTVLSRPAIIKTVIPTGGAIIPILRSLHWMTPNQMGSKPSFMTRG